VADVSDAASALGLQLRDRIVGVGKYALVRGTEGELLDLIRGPVGDSKLLLDRPGVGEVAVPLPAAKMPGVMTRGGFYIDGALFAVSDLLDIGYLKGRLNVMVHSVASGSSAESARLDVYDHVISANGITITELNDLYEVVDAMQGETLELELLRFVGGEQRFTQHILVELPVENRQEVSLALGQR
jgi:C-terminal processing protease CtpA/Prc